MNSFFRNALRPSEDCQVRPEDLDNLEIVHELLSALNDKHVGNFKIERFIEDIGVLKARVMRRAQRRSPRKPVNDLTQALSIIGNRGLETELFGVLEDLTCLKAELEAQSEP